MGGSRQILWEVTQDQASRFLLPQPLCKDKLSPGYSFIFSVQMRIFLCVCKFLVLLCGDYLTMPYNDC